MINLSHGSKGTLTIRYLKGLWSVPIVAARESLNVVISIQRPPSIQGTSVEIVVNGDESDVAWLLALIRSSLESNDGKHS